jgi:hypothetical protein
MALSDVPISRDRVKCSKNKVYAGLGSHHVPRQLEPAEFVDGAKRAPRG